MASVRVPDELWSLLVEQARRNERTPAAELRVALRAHLEGEAKPAAVVEDGTGGVSRAEVGEWLGERGWSLTGWTRGDRSAPARFTAAKGSTGTVQTAKTVEMLKHRVSEWDADYERRGQPNVTSTKPTVLHGLVSHRAVEKR
jgi:hypothetical protein